MLDRTARGYRVAHALSMIVNPLLLPAVAFGLIAGHAGAGGGEIAWVVTVGITAFCLGPLAYLVYMVRTGQATTIEVPARKNRTRPLLVGAASTLAGALLIALTARTAAGLLTALALFFPLNTVLAAVITRRWKISLHLIGIAGFTSTLAFVALDPTWDVRGWLTPTLLVAWAACIPALMWARVRVGAHTPMQTVGGTLFGLTVPFAELTLVFGWPLG
jgi:membrane-associated phospholipid phosphatase